jgi:dGTPase
MRPDTEIAAHLGEVLWVDGQHDEARRVWREGLDRAEQHIKARYVADFLAGMTDTYALKEHRRLFDRTPDLG